MGCAQTGSGKTAAFMLPILARLTKERSSSTPYEPTLTNATCPKALVLAPTRELACQIHDEAIKFSRGTSIKSTVVYGGVSISNQIRIVERGCDLIIATPGRLVDIIKRGKLALRLVKFLVLDEADRMLDMGFEPQIREIVETFDMPAKGQRQTLMFSATFAKEIQILASSFLHDYVFLTVGRVGSTTELVKQQFIRVESDKDKETKLLELLEAEKGLTLIFVETKQRANILERLLSYKGLSAAAIHGDKDQAARTWALKNFSTGKKSILIATNVAARGLDINNIAHVINVDMPREIDSYVHRIGRTGRAGKNGISTTFISPADGGIIHSLIQTLRDGKQEIPSWLYEMRRGPRSSGSNRGRSNNFGGRDFRSSHSRSNDSSSRPSYYSNNTTSSGYGNRPPAPAFNYAPPPSYQNGPSQYPPAPAPSANGYPSSSSHLPPPVHQQPHHQSYHQQSYQGYPPSRPPPPPASNGSHYNNPPAPSAYPPSSSSSSSAYPPSNGTGHGYGYGSSSYKSSSSSYDYKDDKKRSYDSDYSRDDRDKFRKTDDGRRSSSSSSTTSSSSSVPSKNRYF